MLAQFYADILLIFLIKCGEPSSQRKNVRRCPNLEAKKRPYTMKNNNYVDPSVKHNAL